MYLPPNTLLLKDTRDCGVAHAEASQARRVCVQNQFARGRIAIFQDIISPEQVAAQFGIPAGVSAASMQQQTVDARASAWLYGDGLGSSSAPVMLTSPESFPLNRAGGCLQPHQAKLPTYEPVTPSFPRRAPHIVNMEVGPEQGLMHYHGERSTVRSMAAMGLAGYAPPWSDAFVTAEESAAVGSGGMMGWVQNHPWLSLALAAGGVLVASKGGRR